MNATRKRRRWRIVLLAALVALLGGLALVLAYAADPVRVVALLQDVLRRDFGLALSYEGTPRLTWWPRPGVALTGYRIDVVATQRPLAWGDALEVEVPWRALRADEIAIERVALDGPVFHAAGLEGWALAGPSGAPRWPRVANGIVVRGAKYIGAGAPPRVIEGIGIDVSPIAPGHPLRIDASWQPAADVPELTLELRAIPRDGPEGLALDELALELRRADIEARFDGRASGSDARHWSLVGTLAATRLPAAVARFVDAPATQPSTKLELALDRAEGSTRAVARGQLAGVETDVDLRFTALPDPGLPLPALLASLQRDVKGHARIARLRIGDAIVENFEITDDAAPPE